MLMMLPTRTQTALLSRWGQLSRNAVPKNTVVGLQPSLQVSEVPEAPELDVPKRKLDRPDATGLDIRSMIHGCLKFTSG